MGRKTTEEIAFEVYFDENFYGFALVPTDDNRLIFLREFFGYHGTFENKSVTGFTGYDESMWEYGVNNDIDTYVKPVLRNQNWRVYHFHDTGRSARVK